ncbi:hypothetical protein F4775DRAFT_15190 [Biscogniauxia sp. FL1348]|nr:hypothetical protein F4775DRAFT_15190 [Biscogniauxia sp. FL1348]
MATTDVSSLTSSAQIFTTHTLPQIRAVHKTLHVQIDEKSARLRTQVGNSYRELLGTADTIVRMRGDMRDAQAILGRMGGLCGRAVVGGKVEGLDKFFSSSGSRGGGGGDEGEMGRAARGRLLRACGLAVGRLMKGPPGEGKGDRLVLAAKVLVLGRLLVTSLGDAKGAGDQEQEEEIAAAKKSLVSLRRRLLRAVEKVLEKVGGGDQTASGHSDILKALSAYSLASNSGAKDVLRHFLNVRAEALVYEFDFEEHEKERSTDNVLRGLDLYTRTMLDVQAIVPKKLSEALLALKKEHLLADESLKNLEGLRLDIYKRWCGDEIQYFTPFIRHDDLEGAQAREMLTSWSKRGAETLLKGLAKTLEHMSEFKTIVELRTNVLQQWVREGGKAKGFDPSVMLDDLRNTINGHLLQLLETKVTRLKLVGSEVSATLEAWQTGTTDSYRSLWDEDMLDIDVSNGAYQITHEIISRLHGRNDAVSRAVTCFESWRHIIDNVGELVDQLKRQRWDNDVDEIEDEDILEARQKLLSHDDPQLLYERLNVTLEKSFKDLDQQLGALWQGRKDTPDSGQIAMYILRVLRDVRDQLPKLDGIKSFGLANVPSLHERLAAHISISPLEEFSSATLTRKHVAGRALWEGEPALPTHPSPGAFRLLQNLIESMGNAGLDLWTPAAVRQLKQVFGKQLVDVWRKELEAGAVEAEEPIEESTSVPAKADEGESSEAANDDNKMEASKDPTNDVGRSRDVYIQWLYDIHLMQECFSTQGDAKEVLEALAREVLAKTELADDAEERLTKASREYWKRTSLLFGLLA